MIPSLDRTRTATVGVVFVDPRFIIGISLVGNVRNWRCRQQKWEGPKCCLVEWTGRFVAAAFYFCA